jgi:hypothetical protein
LKAPDDGLRLDEQICTTGRLVLPTATKFLLNGPWPVRPSAARSSPRQIDGGDVGRRFGQRHGPSNRMSPNPLQIPSSFIARPLRREFERRVLGLNARRLQDDDNLVNKA